MFKVCKVPVITQMEMTECGAASLGMILAYYGKWLPMETLREECGVSRDGANALNILKAARNYGLKANGYKYEPEDTKSLNRPVILHWGFNHFVVLAGWKKNGKVAVINDPARGIINVSETEFDKKFTGICIQFEPTEKFIKSGRQQSVLLFILERLKGTREVFLFLTITTAITAIIGIINPIFGQIFTDKILTGGNKNWLNGFILMFTLVIIIHTLTVALQSIYSLKVNARFAVTSGSEFLWHVLSLPQKFFASRSSGDIASRQGLNEIIAINMIQQIVPLSIDAVMIIFYTIMMVSYNSKLSAIAISATLVNLIIEIFTQKKLMNYSRISANNGGKFNGALTAGIEMAETIKASGAEFPFCERLSGYHALQHNAAVNSGNYLRNMGIITQLIGNLSNLVIWMTAVALMIKGEMTVGMFVAFQGFIIGFRAPVERFSSITSSIMDTRVSMERIDDIMKYKPDVSAENKGKYIGGGKLKGSLEFKNVTFGYSKLSDPFIKNFSVSIMPGKIIAFVGESGCGKSTIAKLATGLYEQWDGEILFDGRPIKEIDSYTFRGSVSMVDQDITLFEDSVKNNITMWDDSLEDFAVRLAAKDADMHETIMTRTDGYNHKIIEGGKNFSGGQKQRLEIARVLASEPTIIILDEATSALDSKTEDKVMKNIKRLGVTCIIIAHRLSTIRNADEIFVMGSGEIKEHGTHEELMIKNGIYSKLISET